MIGGMQPSGLADVRLRVDEIRSRISSVQPGFSLGSPAVPMDGTPGEAVPFVPAAGATSVEPGTVPIAPSATRAPVAGDAATLAAKLPPAGQRWAGPIVRAATSAGLDPALLAALVQHESAFDPVARSHAGAIGLGQLMPGTAAGLGVDPHDPEQNLDGAARYLKQQLDRFGRVDLALAAYNAGPNRVAQAGGIPRIAETQTYVTRVVSTYEALR